MGAGQNLLIPRQSWNLQNYDFWIDYIVFWCSSLVEGSRVALKKSSEIQKGVSVTKQKSVLVRKTFLHEV